MNNIVLVGNASFDLKKELGKKIDSFNTVVRFNNFEISPHEKFIGTKTDIWVIAIIPDIKDRIDNNFKKILAIEPWCKESSQRSQWKKSLQNKYPNLEFISQDVSKSCSDLFNFERNKNWCTSGMIAILYFLQFYDKIYICGFGDVSGGHYFSVPTHLNNSASMYHKYNIEKEHIQILEERGKVIIL